jgi:hypothetical protein
MFKQTFYFSTIRKYVILFGTLFNDINIIRTDKTGKMTQRIKVPITYAPKEKMLARVTEDPNIDRQTATITQPMMSFELNGIKYDGSRKLNTTNRIGTVDSSNKNKLKFQYTPVPYDFMFTLYVYSKNTEDGTKIIEQILPFFTPDWTTTVNLIPEMNVVHDIPLILNNINHEDTYEGDFKKRRSMIWTVQFTMKGYIYGPVKSSSVIKFTNTAIYVVDTSVESAIETHIPVQHTTIQPGLTANGQPTSNASLSISRDLIIATDDYGYIINDYEP